MMYYTDEEARAIDTAWSHLVEWASIYTTDLHRRLTGPYYIGEVQQIPASAKSHSTKARMAQVQLMKSARDATLNADAPIKPSELKIRDGLALTYIAISYYYAMEGTPQPNVETLSVAIAQHDIAWERHMDHIRKELAAYRAPSKQELQAEAVAMVEKIVDVIVQVHPATLKTQDQLGEIAADQAAYYGEVTEK